MHCYHGNVQLASNCSYRHQLEERAALMTEMTVVYWPHTKSTSVFVLRMKIVDSDEVSKVQYYAEHVGTMLVRIFVCKAIEFSNTLMSN